MSAQERISVLRDMTATELCEMTDKALAAFADIMNRETTLLRAGDYAEAAALSAEKAQLAQDYVGFARAVQHETPRLRAEAPDLVDRLQSGHERLATQMAENLKVLATARNVTENLLTDVARSVNGNADSNTYGAGGRMNHAGTRNTGGIAVNRAL